MCRDNQVLALAEYANASVKGDGWRQLYKELSLPLDDSVK